MSLPSSSQPYDYILPECAPCLRPGAQSEESLARSQGGLRIRLALVQRLVEKRRGPVEAFRTLGAGSELVVILPGAPRLMEFSGR